MALITMYPSRFTSRADGEGVVISQGDATVKALTDIYHARTAVSRSWKFRRSVVETALRLFGNFDTWLKDQRANPHVVGTNRQFIEDTFNFIHGKPRTMSVVLWGDVIHDAGDLRRLMTQQALGAEPTLSGSRESTVLILQQWLARDNGIEDLILTLNVLFGERVLTTSDN